MAFIGPRNNGDSYGLAIQFSADMRKLDAGIKQANAQIQSLNQNMVRQSRQSGASMESVLGGAFKRIGVLAAGAFSVQAITQFTGEAVKLAASAEGIKAAFERLNRPDLLNNLVRATRGTVTNVELMRQAVRANNFQVPLEKLASFFEFATKRAAQTGESVDYLVGSIIDGIGRKSTLVLDNLGISAARLQEEVRKVGDFGKAAGNIIEQELAKAGDVALTSSQKIAQLNTSIENLKTSLGGVILNNLGTSLDEINKVVDTLNKGIKQGAIFNLQEQQHYEKIFGLVTDDVKKAFEDLTQGSEEYRAKMAQVQTALMRAEFELIKYKKSAHQNGLTTAELMAKKAALEAFIKSSTQAVKEETQANKDNTLSIEEATAAQEKAILSYLNLQGAMSSAMGAGSIVGPDVDFLEIPDEMAQMAEDFENAQDAIEDLTVESKKFFASQAEGAKQLANMGNVIGNSFADAFASIIDGTASIDEALKRLLADLTAALIRMLIIRGIMAAFTGGASEATGIASAASGAIARGIGVGSFADGGIISGPTLGLMGEYAGARNNPEVVAPLDKLRSLIGGEMSASVRVSGEDLVIMLEKAQGRLERKRGF